MLKKIAYVILACVLVPVAAMSFKPTSWMRATSQQTADHSVLKKAGWFYGILVQTDGTNEVWVDVYDVSASMLSEATAGSKLIPQWVITTSSSDRMQSLSLDPPVPFDAGLFVDISTAGSVKFTTYYNEQ